MKNIVLIIWFSIEQSDFQFKLEVWFKKIIFTYVLNVNRPDGKGS